MLRQSAEIQAFVDSSSEMLKRVETLLYTIARMQKSCKRKAASRKINEQCCFRLGSKRARQPFRAEKAAVPL